MKKKHKIQDPELLSTDVEEVAVEHDESEQDSAFIDSENRTWGGKKLRSYAAMLQATAQRLGLRYGRLKPEDVEEFKTTGQYSGLNTDVYIVLWLCAKASKSDAYKAQRLPEWGLDQAFTWADEEKLFYPSERFLDAALLFSKIVSDPNASTGEFSETAGDGKPVGNS